MKWKKKMWKHVALRTSELSSARHYRLHAVKFWIRKNIKSGVLRTFTWRRPHPLKIMWNELKKKYKAKELARWVLARIKKLKTICKNWDLPTWGKFIGLEYAYVYGSKYELKKNRWLSTVFGCKYFLTKWKYILHFYFRRKYLDLNKKKVVSRIK